MPTKYTLDLPHRLVRTHSWGVLSDQDVRDLYRDIRADPAFEPFFQQLCDLRQVTRITATVDTLRYLAQSRIFAAGARRAFVVDREVDFGMSRLFSAYSEVEGAVIEVFRNWEEAEEWLGLRVRSHQG